MVAYCSTVMLSLSSHSSHSKWLKTTVTTVIRCHTPLNYLTHPGWNHRSARHHRWPRENGDQRRRDSLTKLPKFLCKSSEHIWSFVALCCLLPAIESNFHWCSWHLLALKVWSRLALIARKCNTHVHWTRNRSLAACSESCSPVHWVFLSDLPCEDQATAYCTAQIVVFFFGGSRSLSTTTPENALRSPPVSLSIITF
jgi:hypothetical protein